MKKRILSLALVVALVAIMLTSFTLAYFTDTTEAKSNVFTVGNVEIELSEPAWTTEEAENVYPGEALPKDPTVTNVGPNPCFVRVKVYGLDQFGTKGEIALRHGNYVPGYDSDNWTLIDGYYYYNKVLAAKADLNNGYNEGLSDVTAPLFNQIVMPIGLDGSEQAQPINIYAEAVQAQGARASYSAVKAMTPAEIAAWFTTCGME